MSVTMSTITLVISTARMALALASIVMSSQQQTGVHALMLYSS
jgi:hypothetical protein